MNNKGFAVSGILYTLLLISVVCMCLLLYNLQNRKVILDELKSDTVNAVESDANYAYLLDQINALKSQIGTTNISGIGDGTVTGAILDINDSITYRNIMIEGGVTISSTSVISGTIDVSLDGYIPVGLVGYNLQKESLSHIYVYVQTDTLYYSIQNNSNSSLTVYPNYMILYRKDI